MKNADCHGIWIFAEQENGVLNETVFELLAKAHELKEKLGGKDEICAVLIGDNAAGLSDTLFAYGAEKVIINEAAELAGYSPRPYAKTLAQLAQKHAPSIFMFPASPMGRDLAPRVMCRLGTGLTADAIDLDIDEDGTFVQTTPAYGGSILAHIAIPERRPQMVTVHPRVFSPLAPDHSRKGEVVTEAFSVEADPCYELVAEERENTGKKSIAGASKLVSVGRGIKSREDLEMLEELASVLGAEIACSRPVCDNKWLPHECQIGQSGTTVKPDLIINVALSGSVQYQAGMDKSGCIMSINHTQSAPIYDISHYGAAMDYKKLVPALIKELKSELNI